MHYPPLGNTGLTASVAGLGCGGNSRLGLGRGASFDECVAVALKPTTITLMHGPTFKGDGAAALEGLAEHYGNRSS